MGLFWSHTMPSNGQDFKAYLCTNKLSCTSVSPSPSFLSMTYSYYHSVAFKFDLASHYSHNIVKATITLLATTASMGRGASSSNESNWCQWWWTWRSTTWSGMESLVNYGKGCSPRWWFVLQDGMLSKVIGKESMHTISCRYNSSPDQHRQWHFKLGKINTKIH